jgi:single-strand DNA-binding protein
MSSINNVVIQGNLVADPEEIGSGENRGCSFRLAWNEKWKGKDGTDKERAGFVKVVVWGGQAKAVLAHMEKGKPVMVNGSLRFEEWENEEGQKRTAISVNARDVQFLPTKKAEE